MPRNILVGTVTLTESKLFTQYSEHAAWTDYVRCEPQTVPLRYVDNYWLCAAFEGVCERSTYPDASRRVGTPDTGHCQWSYAGFDPDELREQGFEVVLNAGELEERGHYSAGTGKSAGRPIKFFRLTA